mmetsp:Transcript_63776/g.120764  ORF Transcript_63776/g.120764 Transcript_63776/m.120764 type:complete len:266 (+) Transcript_63776:712-1509(+)
MSVLSNIHGFCALYNRSKVSDWSLVEASDAGLLNERCDAGLLRGVPLRPAFTRLAELAGLLANEGLAGEIPGAESLAPEPTGVAGVEAAPGERLGLAPLLSLTSVPFSEDVIGRSGDAPPGRLLSSEQRLLCADTGPLAAVALAPVLFTPAGALAADFCPRRAGTTKTESSDLSRRGSKSSSAGSLVSLAPNFSARARRTAEAAPPAPPPPPPALAATGRALGPSPRVSIELTLTSVYDGGLLCVCSARNVPVSIVLELIVAVSN